MKRWRLCREIDNVFGCIPACFVHVLLKFSGFFVRAEIFMNLPWSLGRVNREFKIYDATAAKTSQIMHI